eukprot:scaffold59329_cov56-Phaeocystis_antarctica.AAC.3
MHLHLQLTRRTEHGCRVSLAPAGECCGGPRSSAACEAARRRRPSPLAYPLRSGPAPARG